MRASPLLTGAVAVIVGTSTSGILHTELAFRDRDPTTGALPSPLHYRETHELSSAAAFVRRYFELTGPVLSISTACSSSAKVFASAWRMLQTGLCDAVLVGGVDSLCLTTLYGFSSLELVADEPCRPADADRGGISIGEAAGFALLENRENAPDADLGLLGYGESVDAYHMSTPHPDGLGAALAMQQALDRAGLAAADIDYINLHGTASRSNDSAEDKAVSRLFGTHTPCSSTKGWTGHTLGAAGITEAVIGLLCIENGLVPGSLNTRHVDPGFMSRVVLKNEARPVRRVLSNSFGFGGNNASLILGRFPDEATQHTTDRPSNNTANKLQQNSSSLPTVYLDGIGLFAPGIADWTQARAVLNGITPFDLNADLPAFNIVDLPATERRRAGRSVKLAVDLAAQAVQAAQIDPTQPAAVFASTSGDTDVLTDICAALATDDRMISPMRFHNSVHNAASGYWTIAQQNRQPTTAIALHNLTASAGLLEAATQAAIENTPVLLVIYDIPFPSPLDAAEPISTAFGMSFLLQPQRTNRSMAQLSLSLAPDDQSTVDTLPDPALEALRTGVAAARALPLLTALAKLSPENNSEQTVTLDYLSPQVLTVDIRHLTTQEAVK